MTAPRPRAVPDLPPHDLDAERLILGSCIWRDAQIPGLDLLPEELYSPANALVWAAMLELSASGLDVTTNALRTLLADRGELSVVGGHDYLLSLTDGVPLPVEPADVARIKRLATLRVIGDRAMELAVSTRLVESDAHVTGVYQRLTEAQHQLSSLDRRAALPSLADVVEAMQFDGRRLQTALPTFDDLLRGGLPTRRLVTVLGAPGGGKTTLMTCLMDGFEQQGASCLYFASDESREGIAVRLGQLSGHGRQAMESPHDVERRRFAAKLRQRPHLVIVDPRRDRMTIEDAARRLALHAGTRIPVLIVDSLQTALSASVDPDASEYERIETVTNVLEDIALRRNMLVFGISEMSRAAYRSGGKGADTRALAGGKGAGRIEYASDLQISLTEVDPQKPGLVDVEVTKNRLTGKKPVFRIQIDDASASVREVEAPVRPSPVEAAEQKARQQLEQAKQRIRQALRTHRDLKSQRDVLGVCMGARGHNATAFNQMLNAEEIVQVDGCLRLRVGT